MSRHGIAAAIAIALAIVVNHAKQCEFKFGDARFTLRANLADIPACNLCTGFCCSWILPGHQEQPPPVT